MIISLITVLAYFIHNLGLLNNFSGAILGSAVIYIFPMMCVVYAVKNDCLQMGASESLFVKALVAMGVVLAIVGSIVAVTM